MSRNETERKEDSERTYHLYRRLGYREIVTMRFWTGDAWYYVMGADLPLPAARDTAPPADTIGSR